MIVAFEGLNGVGKSNMAKKFAEEFNYKYLARPIYNVFGVDKEHLGEEYKVLDYRIKCSQLFQQNAIR